MGGFDTAQAAANFRRVRIAEERLPDGGKSVWHQAEGAEIVSRVDAGGRVVSQELTLGSAVIEWKKDEPLRTARVRSNERQGMVEVSGSAIVDRDKVPNPATIVNAIAFLRKVPAGDRYVEHLAEALEAYVTASPAAPGDQVTQFGGDGEGASPAPAGTPSVTPDRRGSLALALAIGALLAAAAVGWLLIR